MASAASARWRCNGRIVPGQSVLGRISCFEPGDIALGQVVCGSLVRRVAVVNAAPERPALAGGAVPALILPRARFAVDPAAGRLAARCPARSRTSAVETKSVCPYSLKRQQRPLNWQTGPSCATSASSSVVQSREARLRPGIKDCGAFRYVGGHVDPSFRGLRDG